jgi:hypothetical protein
MPRIDRSPQPFTFYAGFGASKWMILRAQNRFLATLVGRTFIGGNPERPPQMLCICAPYRGFRGRSDSLSLAGKFRISAYVFSSVLVYGQSYECNY